jgi:biopolymer transport protein ExbB/TolQ
MNITTKTRFAAAYSPIDLAFKHLRECLKTTKSVALLPVPLIAGAILGFNYFHPAWHTNLFLWSILLLFAFGQAGSLFQLLTLYKGVLKAVNTLGILRRAGHRPDLQVLQKQLMVAAPSCQIRDNVLNWIQLGIQGETDGIERIMEHAAVRRDQNAARIISFHSIINRTTLKLGFLGTLIGLMMTFDPMKQAMLSLQSSQGEFRFVTDIVRAIDADAFAIIATLFATGLSIFIELLTIQFFERILHKFELVNNDLDDWCIIYLQPWIKEASNGKKSNDDLIEFQKQFAEKITVVQKAMDEQVRALATGVLETGQQIAGLAVIQKETAKKISDLTEDEKQYRAFLQSKLARVVPPAGDKGATA